MPKLRTQTIRPPGPRKQLADELHRLYGGALTLTDVMDAIGVRDPQAARNWIQSESLDAVMINGRKKWLAGDIAKALDNSKIRGAVC